MKTEVLPQWIQKNKKKLLARADSHHMVVADQNQTKATVNKELHYYAFIMNAKGNTMAENDDRNYQSGSQESETSRPDRRRLEEEEQI